MSVKDFIKKSVLENFSPYNVPQMAAALFITYCRDRMVRIIHWY